MSNNVDIKKDTFLVLFLLHVFSLVFWVLVDTQSAFSCHSCITHIEKYNSRKFRIYLLATIQFKKKLTIIRTMETQFCDILKQRLKTASSVFSISVLLHFSSFLQLKFSVNVYTVKQSCLSKTRTKFWLA